MDGEMEGILASLLTTGAKEAAYFPVSDVIWKYWLSLWKKKRNKFLTSWGHLSPKKTPKNQGRVQNWRVYILYVSFACVSTFFPSTFLLKVSEHTYLYLCRKNEAHSGTSCTCAYTIFPSNFYLNPPINTCTLIYLQWASHLFPLIHPYHVCFARKAKGGDLHQKEAE